MGQVMEKFKKGGPTNGQVGKLAEDIKPIIEPIIEKVYNDELKDKEVGYDDLYHAIFDIIQDLREAHGALQFELPPKEKLKEAFEDCRRSSKSSRGLLNKEKWKLEKEDCREIIGKMITLESFSIGQGAIDVLLYLFGIPICALLAKKIIPGMKSISDDVVIPVATSASVIFLAKTNKL